MRDLYLYICDRILPVMTPPSFYLLMGLLIFTISILRLGESERQHRKRYSPIHVTGTLVPDSRLSPFPIIQEKKERTTIHSNEVTGQ